VPPVTFTVATVSLSMSSGRSPALRAYGLGVVFDPQRARNGSTLTNHVFALWSITSHSTSRDEAAFG
jgi:hypothetical protein